MEELAIISHFGGLIHQLKGDACINNRQNLFQTLQEPTQDHGSITRYTGDVDGE